jgi:thiol:disulfide interchange protein DsbD
MSLSNAAQNRKRCLVLGTFMSVGVVSFWMLLAFMIAFVSNFTATNQLFHYPFFTITVGAVIATMAIGMCGLFAISPPPILYRFTPQQETLAGSFGLGVMTAILSTPCTAPFMGAAAAWAATKHPVTTLTTFAAIGIGMALPYILLSAFPALVTKMPRSGPAGVLIKQVMGLLMLSAAAYFMGSGVSAWLTVPPDPPSKAFWWIVLGFSTAAGAWLIYRTLKITARRPYRFAFSAIGLLMMAVSWWGIVPLTRSGPVEWINYTPQRIEAALKQGKIVVLDFTAEWCLNCKALESGVLSSPKVVRLFAADDVVPFKVDLTAHNPAGKAKLIDVGQLSIPLLVVYAPTGNMIFKSDFYTPQQIEAAIHQARQKN